MAARELARRVHGLALSVGCIQETAAICVPTIVDAALGRLTSHACDARLERWSRRVLERVDATLQIEGVVPPSGPFVVMSNHSSFLDIPVVYRLFGGHLRMVAKKELFAVPVFGRAMLDAGFVRVDRSDRAAAVQSLELARALIAGGTSVWIAPEGTRSKSGALGPLKKGGFMLALQTGRPILPITVRGTRDILPSGSFMPRPSHTVRVSVHAPIPTDTLPTNDAHVRASRDRLMREVQTVLESSL